MLCRDLKEGMLIKLSDEKFCAWISWDDNNRGLSVLWPDIPPRLRVASVAIGLLTSSGNIQKSNDAIVYIGKKLIQSKVDNKTRQIRMVLAGGEVGYIEGYDIKHFEPVKKEDNTPP